MQFDPAFVMQHLVSQGCCQDSAACPNYRGTLRSLSWLIGRIRRRQDCSARPGERDDETRCSRSPRSFVRCHCPECPRDSARACLACPATSSRRGDSRPRGGCARSRSGLAKEKKEGGRNGKNKTNNTKNTHKTR